MRRLTTDAVSGYGKRPAHDRLLLYVYSLMPFFLVYPACLAYHLPRQILGHTTLV